MLQKVIQWSEQGYVPDEVIRMGMRQLVQKRYRDEKQLHHIQNHASSILQTLSQGPIAENTQEANEQHYEVPSQFYQKVLGPALKYSSALFQTKDATLAQAEQAMLQKYGEFAQLKDGMRILELGCGWGSLTLWMAKQYPNSVIEGVSNSTTQREYIMDQSAKHGLSNVTIHTADINDYDPGQTYDRIVSVEMFEHMRNYNKLFEKISTWLHEEGKLFVHIFCHQQWSYLFETQGADNWMGRYFFTGGVMPSYTTFEQVQPHLSLEEKQWVSGQHYQQTAAHWRKNLQQHESEIQTLFAQQYSQAQARRWVGRWNMFFMACEELFGYRQGQEWGVGLYRFVKQTDSA